eukprot:GABV01013776.1.p1 GENE.GABV01013776.1~~GABV01013776.1.p1  ORF type:complete len:117 (-),score=35.50 GABV01013776.1:3-353(-)
MKFVSTRAVDNVKYSFEQALLAGWAEDGGLLMPERIPKIKPETLDSWRQLSYPQLAAEILALFVDESELDHADLLAITTSNLFHPRNPRDAFAGSRRSVTLHSGGLARAHTRLLDA